MGDLFVNVPATRQGAGATTSYIKPQLLHRYQYHERERAQHLRSPNGDNIEVVLGISTRQNPASQVQVVAASERGRMQDPDKLKGLMNADHIGFFRA